MRQYLSGRYHYLCCIIVTLEKNCLIVNFYLNVVLNLGMSILYVAHSLQKVLNLRVL